jgi:4-oxalocrotonate tautomerase
MPVVTVEMWEGRSLEQKRSLVRAITEAMIEHAEARPDALHVILHEIPHENWGRGGELGVDRVDS